MFEGFPTDTVEFLTALSAHNDTQWFEAHRKDYEAHWVEPAKAFVEAAGAALSAVTPVSYEPRINGSIRRIHRDLRFSKDTRPYKDHLDMSFWVGERASAVSGFYVRITPAHLGIGAGAHHFDRDRLAAYRAAVADDERGRSLTDAITAVEAEGYPVRGEHYKRVPAGIEVDDPDRLRLSKFSALWTGEDRPHPDDLFGPGAVDHVVAEWCTQLPLHTWLVDTLG